MSESLQQNELLNNYQNKYLKYKSKYLQLKKLNFKQLGSGKSKNKLKRMEGITPNYTETLSEPWFTLISMGLKTIEGRRNKGRFKEMKIGDIIEWTNDDFKPRKVITKLTGKAEYNTFEDYLLTEGLDKCLPGIKDLETGLSVYYKYFTKEDEKEFGVVAIRIELL